MVRERNEKTFEKDEDEGTWGSGMSRSDWPTVEPMLSRIGPSHVSPPSLEIHFLRTLLQNWLASPRPCHYYLVLHTARILSRVPTSTTPLSPFTTTTTTTTSTTISTTVTNIRPPPSSPLPPSLLPPPPSPAPPPPPPPRHNLFYFYYSSSSSSSSSHLSQPWKTSSHARISWQSVTENGEQWHRTHVAPFSCIARRKPVLFSLSFYSWSVLLTRASILTFSRKNTTVYRDSAILRFVHQLQTQIT